MNIQSATTATIRDAIASAVAALSQNEYLRDTATRDAELLLLSQLQINRAALFAHPERLLTEAEELRYRQSIQRRLDNEPIQYITGTQEFYGLDFHVTPAVLIPRPETELLIEATLSRLPRDQHIQIADVGTGSGIIAIALAKHLPNAEFTALDISPEALVVARHNAETHNVASRIRFLQSDLFSSVAEERYDAVLSNPPYVPAADRETLHPQVREHEPHTALFAGPAGLDIYTRLIPQADTALKSGGLLVMEIGYGQEQALRQLLKTWQDVSFLNDLQQIPRTAIARKP